MIIECFKLNNSAKNHESPSLEETFYFAKLSYLNNFAKQNSFINKLLYVRMYLHSYIYIYAQKASLLKLPGQEDRIEPEKVDFWWKIWVRCHNSSYPRPPWKDRQK